MNEREMVRVAHDPAEVRRMATCLTRVGGDALSAWEAEFLASLEAFDGPEPLSIRRREVLVEIDDTLSRSPVMGGYRADHLVQTLYENRLELDEDAEAWVVRLRDRLEDASADLLLSKRQWRRAFMLMRSVFPDCGYVEVA